MGCADIGGTGMDSIKMCADSIVHLAKVGPLPAVKIIIGCMLAISACENGAFVDTGMGTTGVSY